MYVAYSNHFHTFAMKTNNNLAVKTASEKKFDEQLITKHFLIGTKICPTDRLSFVESRPPRDLLASRVIEIIMDKRHSTKLAILLI